MALVALASCSVEKRVYQPGYHIEWNLNAEQDASRDVSQDAERDVSQDASLDVTQDVAQDVSQDASRDVLQDASRDVLQDASRDLSKNLETDVSQDLSKNLETDVSQDLSKNLSKNLDLSQNINSDLEFVLLIILALFLPALTVFLLEGFSKNFWIALLLMAVAYLLPISSFIVRGLIVAIATILAIAVVFHYM